MIKKSDVITWTIILVIVLFAFIILRNPAPIPITDEEIAICIGKNSVLYVQLGCPHCDDQEEMFGEYKKHLNIIDCFYENDKCENISGTPTWKIKGDLYSKVQSIETLKELTGC